MSLADNILKFLSKSKKETDKAPEGICPNCWGKQEYGGKFYTAVKNHGLNINQADDERGWIQDYADKYLLGISLTKHDGYNMCSKCKLKYVEEK